MFFKKNGYAPKKTQISTRYWFIALDTVDWQSIGGTSFPFTKETKAPHCNARFLILVANS